MQTEQALVSDNAISIRPWKSNRKQDASSSRLIKIELGVVDLVYLADQPKVDSLSLSLSLSICLIRVDKIIMILVRFEMNIIMGIGEK